MDTHQTDFERAVACEREPIHIPGAIQPFGVLLGLTLPNLTIHNASGNCETALNITALQLIGRSLAEFVVKEQLKEVQQYLGQDNLSDSSPLSVSLQRPTGPSTAWDLTAHWRDACLVVELEPADESTPDVLAFHRKIRDAVQALQSAESLHALCEAAVRQVRDITGFDRVKLYRFDKDWHGEVIAEARALHMQSYLGHHFPASDIPAQARAVFLQNWLRMIPDVDYTPVELYPGTNPLSGAPLDLGCSTLRSVSPVHLEYLRNMGVQATLTISLIDEGKLWGLIACHHAAPLKIGSDERLGAKMVGQLVSSQIQLKQSLDERHYRAQLQAAHDKLLVFMEQEEDLVQGLVKYTPNMLDMGGATGSGAAIHYDGKWTLIGQTPPVAEIERLTDWLAGSHGHETLFHTNRLSSHFPAAAAYKDVASGLAAINIPKAERNYILWFRPEVATTITWAGNPEKSVKIQSDRITLHPRKSFVTWREVVEGMASPWKEVEIQVIRELRNSILAMDLQREFKKEQAARALAERISREKENMVHVVSHDLRTPLSIVRMGLEFLQHTLGSQPQVVRETLGRSIRAADGIAQLANNILDTAKVEAGAADIKLRRVRAEILVHDAIAVIEPLAEHKGVQLTAHVSTHAAGLHILCEQARIEQVFSNLIGNALKHTETGGTITVSVEPDGKDVLFCVADTGSGILPESLTKIFDRFWQEAHAKGQGVGLGLSIVRSIVEQHHGRIWAESTLGVGSRFYFALPGA